MPTEAEVDHKNYRII